MTGIILRVWGIRSSTVQQALRLSVLIGMNSASVENDGIDTASSISISRSSPRTILSRHVRTSYSLIGSLINDGIRRSVRLSTKSSQQRSTSSAQAIFHRTISGGVESSRSPKLNHRKRTSGSVDTNGDPVSSFDRSTITRQGVGNGVNTPGSNTLPSDQSDDEEMVSGDNLFIKRKQSGLASRSEVLSYFSIESTGYKCKLCNEVSLSVANSWENAPRIEISSAMRVSV